MCSPMCCAWARRSVRATSDFGFGREPVFDVVTVLVAARRKQLVRTSRDALVSRHRLVLTALDTLRGDRLRDRLRALFRHGSLMAPRIDARNVLAARENLICRPAIATSSMSGSTGSAPS